MKTPKYILGVILVTISVIFLYSQATRKTALVINFDECLAEGNMVGESYPRQCWTKDGKHFVEELSNKPEVEVTINGEVTCLPKKGNGPHTMECAIGLLAENGDYYSLINLSEVDPDYKFSVGWLKVVVQGTLISDNKTGLDGNPYNTVGSINVKNITQN